MPIIGEHVEIERKPKLGGGGPGKIPHRRGYGGGDDGDGDRRGDSYSSQQRLRRGRVGVAIVITLVMVMFIALTVAYVARLGSTGPYDPDHLRDAPNWKPLTLPYLQLWINSLLLVLSSVTLELTRRGMMRRAEFASMGIVPPERKSDFSWLTLTMVLGLGFLCGQLLAWNTLRAQGAFRIYNPSGYFFVGFIGLHAIHLVGGILALVYTACGHWLHMKFESQRINVEVTAWYWHFLGVLWFGIFALLHFARG
ncbi:MAG TPA: cytochrome c oxidase subunit 3 [Candidatus Angelobacter sp.]|nr:cytochrome c oxidase subunit 3 [Candidatus Angelobacter sp.]